MEGVFKYKTVMVIDDSRIDHYVAEKVIKKYGFAENVICKDSAQAAIDYLIATDLESAALPQVIFLDIRMPEMDGFEFLDKYKKFPETIKTNCIIIMLTSSENPQDQGKVKTYAYVKDYVIKPLNEQKIRRLMEVL